MIRPADIRKKIKLLIMLRLLVATLFLCFGLLAIKEGFVLFALIVVVLVLSTIYVGWLTIGKHLFLLAAVQLALDLILEIVLMYFTGGFDSVFSTLMVLTIFSAGVILRPNDGFITSILGSILFTVMLIFQHWREPSDLVYAGYISYVKVSIYLLVGFLSSAFAEQVSEMEQELRLKERLSYLGEMTAQLAHEIRNPLMAITGAVQLISRHIKNALSETDLKLIQTVENESGRLNRLLEEILDYTRDEKYEFEKTLLASILDEVFVSFSQNPSINSRVELIKSYQKNNHKVEADRDKLKQVFINVMTNSCQAMPQGGKLSVDTVQDGNLIMIAFSDTGPGMSKDQQKKLFQPFQSGRNGGTGIGLALAQKIVRQHGGKITYRSRIGKGSTFYVILPSV
ncbi:MAG: hypothetical protein HY587_06975 [Candidatus Omnitrophica bacterium]|nr:hypothetical protein [Candidatus Omnitrophota bacterium]